MIKRSEISLHGGHLVKRFREKISFGFPYFEVDLFEIGKGYVNRNTKIGKIGVKNDKKTVTITGNTLVRNFKRQLQEAFGLEVHLFYYKSMKPDSVAIPISLEHDDKTLSQLNEFVQTQGAVKMNYSEIFGRRQRPLLDGSLPQDDAKEEKHVSEKYDVEEKEEILSFPVEDEEFEMILVEGGSFMMGSDDDDARDNEKPVHKVTLPDYYIGKYVVTRRLWLAVMGPDVFKEWAPNMFEEEWDALTAEDKEEFLITSYFYEDEGEAPMDGVCYNEWLEFCAKLNELLSDRLPEGYEFRIPTEAQWEYAARGGKNSNGYRFSGSNYLDEVAWCYGNHHEDDSEPGPVGHKLPNELGLYDMSGNVWEWCQDKYDATYYSNSPEYNPKGADSGSNHVIRGGTFGHDEDFCRVSARTGINFDYRLSYYDVGEIDDSYDILCPVGCRIVLVPKE